MEKVKFRNDAVFELLKPKQTIVKEVIFTSIDNYCDVLASALGC
jgi:hypothetical protein